MNAPMVLVLVNGLIKIAFDLWSSVRKIEGKEAIPSFEEIVKSNLELQAKIDAEKKELGK